MANPIYTAKATVPGGRAAGHGRTTTDYWTYSSACPRRWTRTHPEAGTNPEQLFAVGWAAASKAPLASSGVASTLSSAKVSIDSSVSLSPNGSGGFQLSAELAVSLPDVTDAEKAKQIVAAAHQVCPYSNPRGGTSTWS